MTKFKSIFNWSGGKDSTLALHHILAEQKYEVTTLMTTVNSKYDRISMHGVRRELLFLQGESIGLPIREIRLPEMPSMKEYGEHMGNALAEFKDTGVTHSIFGDIFLEDLKKYREERLAEAGLKGHFPLWKRDTAEVIREFIDLGYKTIVVCVDSNVLDESFAGRIIDDQFLADLPDSVDPCGEHGEFHTFVFDGPIFSRPIPIEIGETVFRSYKSPKDPDDVCGRPVDEEKLAGFYFCDLLPV